MSALIEARLAQNDYLAGSTFTPAGIMSVFALTTMRLLRPASSCFFLLISRHIRTYWSIFSASADGPDISGQLQKATRLDADADMTSRRKSPLIQLGFCEDLCIFFT
ncbi:hypothetical protein [Caballeronia sp. KNU42]